MKKKKVRNVLEKHIAITQSSPVRLSDYVPGIFTMISTKKGMKKAIERGLVLVNGEPGHTSKYINGGELIELCQSDYQVKKPSIFLKMDVMMEDNFMAVVMKPPGIVVSGNKKQTLENALPNALAESTELDALPRPLPAHRLDYPTSGLLLIGKTAKSITALNKLFENKVITKTYHAIVTGVMKAESGVIETPIKGKSAYTSYEVLNSFPSAKYGMFNLLELKPNTGRRHQLRIHLSSIGHPILGDQMYGEEGKVLLGKGLYLHASALSFIHPFTSEEQNLETPLPHKFIRLMENIGARGEEE